MNRMIGEQNPQWKGDQVGYNGLHDWIRERKAKPLLCEKCHERKAIDLANISGFYYRDILDFEYLCRKCHMEKDGRSAQLRLSGTSRKLPERECPYCKRYFYNCDSRTIFCSRICSRRSRIYV